MITTGTPFDNNVVCQVCRETTKASKVRRRWDGLITCSVCWEPRHPLDKPIQMRPENNKPKMATGAEVVIEVTDTSGWIDTLTEIPEGTFTTNNETL